MKYKSEAILLAVALTVTGAIGTYLGSIVTSWNAVHTIGIVGYAPLGIGYGDGYTWITYGNFFTKRIPANGKIVDLLSFPGPSGQGLGYENATKYLYFATGGPYVYVRDSSTAETVRTFACPPPIPKARGLDFDDGHLANPIWLSDENAPTIWNITSTGSVITSFAVPFGGIQGLAYADNVPGGPYLFAGTMSTPSMVYALTPTSGSILYSFKAPPGATGLRALTWDGQYLWTLDRAHGSPTDGDALQFIAYGDFTRVTPASLGRIKALFR